MSADPVILDTLGVGYGVAHLVASTMPPFARAVCCDIVHDDGKRYPISRLTCPDCIRIHRERNAAATEGADHD